MNAATLVSQLARAGRWLGGRVANPAPGLRTQQLKAIALGLLLWTGATAGHSWLIVRYEVFYEARTQSCLPWAFYASRRGEVDPASVKVGEIVMFEATDAMQPVLSSGARIGKLVAAVAGDEVEVRAGHLLINGQQWGTTHLGAFKFAKPVNFWDRPPRVLAPGEIFVFGSEPRSWDSRYWGVIRIEQVKAIVHPII